MEYIIYCDESISRGRYFSNFYGGALVRSTDLQQIETLLNQKKQEIGFNREIKWSRVSAQYLDRYLDFMNTFLGLIRSDIIKIRIMFTQNKNVPIGLTADQIKNSYFLLYYQFLKHSFGLPYSNPTSEKILIKLNLDQVPDTREKVANFKNYLIGLNKNPQFKEAKIELRADCISEVDSSKHVILQGLDIILGSMAFRLNDGHKEKPEGKRRRGKRTIAKEKLYKLINSQIREVYPRFNIGVSTGLQGDITNQWKHPYRHWLFVPSEYEVDSMQTK